MWNPSSLFQNLVLAFLVLSVEVQSATNKFGPEWILGITPATILYAETTLFLPDSPNPPRDSLLIWAGMPTNQNERYQQVLASYNLKKGMCAASTGQWCAYPRIFTGNGKAVAVDPAEAKNGIKMQFTFNPSTGKMLQTMSSSIRMLASWEKASGRPQRFQTALECQEQCSGIINAHAFRNTTIRLSQLDPNWGNTVKTSLTWTPEPLSTFDRGLTWQIATINIQQVSF
ncbi:gb [Venturia nashicola]|uniref:Gb n=1 Tax=Venturia nashicola TaxID=86259 RepID=A0A4Z1PGN3_9PEZI|nr:gb [Venturia nashicola]